MVDTGKLKTAKAAVNNEELTIKTDHALMLMPFDKDRNGSTTDPQVMSNFRIGYKQNLPARLSITHT